MAGILGIFVKVISSSLYILRDIKDTRLEKRANIETHIFNTRSNDLKFCSARRREKERGRGRVKGRRRSKREGDREKERQ